VWGNRPNRPRAWKKWGDGVVTRKCPRGLATVTIPLNSIRLISSFLVANIDGFG
jgi:hypothetical protein